MPAPWGVPLALTVSAAVTAATLAPAPTVPLSPRDSSPICASALPAQARAFRFDGAFAGSPGLVFSFSRGTSTTTHDGTPIGPDVPRYAPETTLAGAPLLESVREDTGQISILGSGLDHDGTTPLLVVLDLSGQRLDVFAVAGEDLLRAEQNGVGRIRTELAGAAFNDVLRGAVPGKLYSPRAATICHGLIVLFCEVLEDADPPAGLWRSRAVAFVLSQDQGRTWQLHHEDSAVDVGVRRGQTWSLQNWWPSQPSLHPLAARFVATDYRHQSAARGGRTFLFRAARAGVGSAWTIDPVETAYETTSPTAEHVHAAALLPFRGNGQRVLSAVGDGQGANRISSVAREDPDGPAGSWIVEEDYHGTRASGADPGVWANQFVGSAPGGAAAAFLAGADVATEGLVSISATDATPSHPWTRFVYGLDTASGLRPVTSSSVRTPTPERGGPYTASLDLTVSDDPLLPLAANRIAYSPDGTHWAEAFASLAGATGCVHGDHIYAEQVVLPGRLVRARVPELRIRRPLAVGPGGLQRGRSDAFASSTQPLGITPLVRSADGAWVHDGRPLDPQPPAVGQVFHLVGSRFASTTEVGRIFPCAEVPDVGDRLDTDALAVRLWMLNHSAAATADVLFELCDDQGPLDVARRLRVNSVDTWIPILAIDRGRVRPGARIQIRVSCGSGYAPNPALPSDLDAYVALDSVAEGVGSPGYALPADASAPAAGSWFPDEIVAVRGFQTGPAWTVTLAGRLPGDAWDSTVTAVGQWPLATLWGDASNHVELLAVTASPFDSRLVARVKRDGEVAATLQSSPLFWGRASALLVAVADPGDGTGVRVTASAAGIPAEDLGPAPGTLLSSSPRVAPTEIRFGAPLAVSGDGIEVRTSPMLWWGGEIREGDYLDAAHRADQLTCLTFLDAVPPAMVDGDLVCPARDNCVAVANADQRDTDRDGVGDACDECPLVGDPDQADGDCDGRGDACDSCPSTFDPAAEDADQDAVGDVCDNCPADPNAPQADANGDGTGDVCDLDDDLVWEWRGGKTTVRWQPEHGSTSWNVYFGSLDVLRTSGGYTQAPGSHALAARRCGLTEATTEDPTLPGSGEVSYSLVARVADGIEGSLGPDGGGMERPNTAPCP